MKKAYLLAYSDSLGTQDQVKNWLNTIPEVTHWRFDMAHSVYYVSTLGAKAVALKIRGLAGDKGMFIITEIPKDSYGWLTGESWYLISNLEYKPK